MVGNRRIRTDVSNLALSVLVLVLVLSGLQLVI